MFGPELVLEKLSKLIEVLLAINVPDSASLVAVGVLACVGHYVDSVGDIHVHPGSGGISAGAHERIPGILTSLCRPRSADLAVNSHAISKRRDGLHNEPTRALYSFGPMSGGVVLVGN